MNEIFRHGDVLLRRIEALPTDEKLIKKADPILEYGELTGHAHRLEGGMVQVYATEGIDQTATYLSVEEQTELIHEEHDAIKLEPGTFEVVRQREFNPYERATRNVYD